MANDQLFQKRKRATAKQLERNEATKKSAKRFLITCEGEKTEPLYLTALIQSLGLSSEDVKICNDRKSAPINVVQLALETLKVDPDYDVVYCVFDRDTHESYDTAIAMLAKSNNSRTHNKRDLVVISSVPCFEFWFLLHHKYSTAPYVAKGGKSCGENLIVDLKKHKGFEEYTKGNNNYFPLLKGKMGTAKENAKKVIIENQKTGSDNPSTKMHILVETIEKARKDFKGQF